MLVLSSFQLETTSSLRADVATVLNLSEDHLDRYESYQAYVDAKKRVYRKARSEVINRDEPDAPQITLADSISFGLSSPIDNQAFGILESDGVTYLARGNTRLLDAGKLGLRGRQNWLNALAALAIVAQFGMDIPPPMLDSLCAFKGLTDRCELIAEESGIAWINDSKGTNVGATLAAIEGFNQPKILIMGGQAKGADLSPLKAAMAHDVREVILIGEDAQKIAKAIEGSVEIYFAQDMEDAIDRAACIAVAGDAVLLSPACASFDMFQSYAARGDAFRKGVLRQLLTAKGDKA